MLAVEEGTLAKAMVAIHMVGSNSLTRLVGMRMAVATTTAAAHSYHSTARLWAGQVSVLEWLPHHMAPSFSAVNHTDRLHLPHHQRGSGLNVRAKTRAMDRCTHCRSLLWSMVALRTIPLESGYRPNSAATRAMDRCMYTLQEFVSEYGGSVEAPPAEWWQATAH